MTNQQRLTVTSATIRLRRGKSVILLAGIGLLVFSASAVAQEPSTIDEFDRAMQEQNQAFEDFVTDMNTEWDAWVLADSLAFEAFKADIEAKWGRFTGTTKKDWVEYSPDQNQRSVVDFEKGEAVVEVLLTPEEALSEDGQLARLEEAVVQLVTDQGKTMDYPVEDEQPEVLSPQPILEDQVADRNGNVVTSETAPQFAKELVQQSAVVQTPVAGKDGVTRMKLTVTIPLVPKHLRVRAEKFLEPIREYSRRYNLDQRMVLALMQTESYFNPKAKSHIPAYGLMQLVPGYGGKDAYEAVYGFGQQPTPNFLYVPRNNIELGCAYLNILMTRYLRKIDDPLSRMYCSICAYNTGAGNVSKAFTGERRVGPAARIINTMTPDEVLSRLKQDLPYQETKDYITRILDRMKYYEEWNE